jgi:hypothetical protein
MGDNWSVTRDLAHGVHLFVESLGSQAAATMQTRPELGNVQHGFRGANRVNITTNRQHLLALPERGSRIEERAPAL